jgi:hypothetical protein
LCNNKTERERRGRGGTANYEEKLLKLGKKGGGSYLMPAILLALSQFCDAEIILLDRQLDEFCRFHEPGENVTPNKFDDRIVCAIEHAYRYVLSPQSDEGGR